MSREVSEAGATGTPVQQAEHLNSEPFVQEFLHLVDEGWEPDLEEFLDRVPTAIREEVFERLDATLEQRTEKTWDESAELDEGHVLSQTLGDESSESIMAAALGDFGEPDATEHVAPAELQAPTIIPLAEPFELNEERFAPSAAEPEPEPEPEPVMQPEAPELAVEPEPEPDPELVDEHEEWNPGATASSLSSVAGMDLRRDLGRGTIGESFLGIDAQGAQKVVTIASSDVPAKVLQRLYGEAAKVKALHVEQLVAIEETRHEPAGTIVIAPYVEGEPIDLAVAELELDDRVRYLQIVIEALASAHAAGLLHLNLKPSNVLVTPSGDVRLLDFGVGAAVMSVPERMAKLSGPGHFASPEHAGRGRVSAASDVFSFGSLMYRILTRKLPFPGGAPDLIRDRIDVAEPQAPRLHDDGIPLALQDICLACLSRKPDDRPDAGTLIASFDRYFVGRPMRLRPTLYRGVLRRETRDVIAQAHAWRGQGFADARDSDQIEVACRRILAREENWTYDRGNAPRTRAIVVIGTLLFALSASLLVRFGYAHVSLFAVLFPVLGVGALLVVGLRTLRRGETALADALLGGAIVALAPALATVMQRTGLLAGAAPVAGARARSTHGSLVAPSLSRGVPESARSDCPATARSRSHRWRCCWWWLNSSRRSSVSAGCAPTC